MSLPPNVPQCQHVKPNGIRCASPALKGRAYCYFHYRNRQPQPGYNLPLLEDANAIQLAVMHTVRALMDNRIDTKRAGLILYGLQVASINLGRVDFDPLWYEVVRVDPDEHPAHERKRLKPASEVQPPELRAVEGKTATVR